MKEGRKVSVLLPVYCGSTYLGFALDSVLAQWHEDFEVIAIDDCSTDNSLEILKSYAAADSRIRVMRNDERQGLFANYNKCLEQASGSFIKPFAQDDLLHPECLKRAVEAMESDDTIALVAMRRGVIDSSGQEVDFDNSINQESPFHPRVALAGSDVIRSCLFPLMNKIGEPSTVMYRRESAGTGFDTSFYHLGDLDYWLTILLEGDLYYEPDQLVFFRHHAQSASTNNLQGMMAAPDIIRMARKYRWIIEDCGRDYNAYIKECIERYALYIEFMSGAGDINSESLRAAPVELGAIGGETDSKLLETITDLRELLFHSMKLIANDSKEIFPAGEVAKKIARNQAAIKSLEAEARALLSSHSWRWTRILRELNRFSARAEGAGDLTLYSWDEALPEKTSEAIAQQEGYIRHLNDVIGRVQNSRSWRLTRPLRAVRRILGSSQVYVVND